MNKDQILHISSMDKDEVFKYFQIDAQGLSSSEVKKRQSLYGLNLIQNVRKFNFWKTFIKQFFSIFAILLWVSSLLAFIIGEHNIAIAIVTVIIYNGIFSFTQEYKTNKILSSLESMMPKKVQVYRDYKIQMLDVAELTIGDLIFLDIGMTLPADARLIETNNFYVDNSMLTGETLPLDRNALPNKNMHQEFSEIPNLVYAGTSVAQGSAKAVVYSIGKETQIGEISHLSSQINKGISTLEKELHKVINKIIRIASSLAFLVFVICYFCYSRDSSVSDTAFKLATVTALGMLVANIPEGLLPTISLSLALGVKKMAKRQVLIKQLYSVETLNSTTVICTDKTGTLTKNELTCCKILFPGGVADITGHGFEKKGIFQGIDKIHDDKILNKILIAIVLCSEANLIENPQNKDHFQILGNPTEGSLLISVAKYGLDIEQVRKNFAIEKINPFCSDNKKMSVLVRNITQNHYDLNQKYLFIKGAFSVLIEECNHQYKNQKVMFFTQKEKDFFIEQNNLLSQQGYRILAIAYKKIEQTHYKETDMVFLGLAVHYDPPKVEVLDAVNDLYKAGLKITIITGDYGLTALAIGKQTGIIRDQYVNITGAEIDDMTVEELQKKVKTPYPLVFSRTTPKHKLKIVEAYRANGEVVGIIGDGVNDILAMKAANIGIAMGKSGKDVACNAADMILLNDDFSAIPKALLEARNVYANIKKFMIYVLSSNIPQIFPIIFMAFTRMPLYLTVIQILAIDLITDLLPAIALGGETLEKNLLDQKPITTKDRLLDKKVFYKSYCFLGMVEGFLAFIFFMIFGGYELFKTTNVNFKELASNPVFKTASTMAFGAVIFGQIGNVLACRSNKLYFWQTITKRNKLLYIGIISELIFFLIVSTDWLSPVNDFFHTIKIKEINYIYLIFCIFVMLIFDTLYKFILNKKEQKK